jgi:hypothetical protein
MGRRSADRADKIEALKARYQEGQFTETVFRASLYAIGLRGADIDDIVRDTPPPKRRLP